MIAQDHQAAEHPSPFWTKEKKEKKCHNLQQKKEGPVASTAMVSRLVYHLVIGDKRERRKKKDEDPRFKSAEYYSG